MDNSKYRILVSGVHFKRDENNIMIINPTIYVWTIGKKALKPGEVIEKGD